jgi:hypothetical protein
MTEEPNAMFTAATRDYVSKHWETVRMLDGVDVGGLPLVDRAVLRFVMSDMLRLIDVIANGRRDREWSDAASPGLGRSIEDLQQKIEAIRLATKGSCPQGMTKEADNEVTAAAPAQVSEMAAIVGMLDAADVASLPQRDRALLSEIVEHMAGFVAKLRGDLCDGGNAAATAGLADSIALLEKRLAEFRAAIAG